MAGMKACVNETIKTNLFREINKADAALLAVNEGDELTISTLRVKTRAYARLTDRVKRGLVFMPFHFLGTNILTTEVTDPKSGITEFKVSACQITRRD